MSMTVVSGLFVLSNPIRIAAASDKPNAPKNYIQYSTSIITQNEYFHDFPATLRYYSPAKPFKNDKRTYLGELPSGTAVISIAKLAIVPSKEQRISNAVLEAIDMFPVPGDVNDDEYEDRAPSFQFPYLFGVGHITGSGTDLGGGAGRVFPAVVEQYVCGSSYTFDIE